MPKVVVDREALVVVSAAFTMVYQPGQYTVPRAHADQIIKTGKGRAVNDAQLPAAPVAPGEK